MRRFPWFLALALLLVSCRMVRLPGSLSLGSAQVGTTWRAEAAPSPIAATVPPAEQPLPTAEVQLPENDPTETLPLAPDLAPTEHVLPELPAAALSEAPITSVPGAFFDPTGLDTPVTQLPAAPLSFVFPEAAPVAQSAWRPPLYPIPWAPTPFDHFYLIRPIAADQVNWPLADYRYGGVFFENITHTGVDIPAPIGAPVLAAGPGKVIWAGYGLYAQKEDLNDPYGLAVSIKHDFAYGSETIYTVYGHMSEINVIKGQRLQTGDLIGLVGETGMVTGPHLHFEVRLGKGGFTSSRNPELWMSPPQGWGLLAGSVLGSSGEPVLHHLIEIYSTETGQSWEVRTYGPSSVNSDPYYRENVVMGDLPAGSYQLSMFYEGVEYLQKLEIRPGLVTYFSFRGEDGFSLQTPVAPGASFLPAP